MKSFSYLPLPKFKQHNSKNKEYPHLAQTLASRVAELISYGSNIKYKNLANDAQMINTTLESIGPTVKTTFLVRVV